MVLGHFCFFICKHSLLTLIIETQPAAGFCEETMIYCENFRIVIKMRLSPRELDRFSCSSSVLWGPINKKPFSLLIAGNTHLSLIPLPSKLWKAWEDVKARLLFKKKIKNPTTTKKVSSALPGKSRQVLVLKGASPTRTDAKEPTMAAMGFGSGRQQMKKQIANTSVFTGACCSLY